MKMLFKLALRNVLGAGLRTWLNVGALSFGFVMVIWMQGLYQGMLKQMTTATVDADYGGGQFWQEVYDPFDPLTLDDAHAVVPDALQQRVNDGALTPVLIASGSVFPGGRAQPANLRGVDPAQSIVNVPTALIKTQSDLIPVMVGERMAKNIGISTGDTLTVRWRDVDGTFDATDVEVVAVMSTLVPNIDTGQLWFDINDLRRMLGTPNEATYLIAEKGYQMPAQQSTPGFVFRDLDFLLQDEVAIYESKQAGGSILYVILMSMGLLAVFDTQVLAIFRRRKEIGTLMALGMNRAEVVSLFTLEGSMNGILALLVGAVYGIPLMAYTSISGLHFPEEAIEDFGMALGATLYTSYAPSVFGATLLILLGSVVFVSFLPARKIVKLKVTDAIRGRIS